MSNKCLVIPREINKNYILIWRQDEIIFLLMPWVFIFVPGGFCGFLIALISTIIVAQALKQLSIDKPNGYMIHWVKYNVPKQFIATIFSKKSDLKQKESLFFRGETFPPTHIRHIAG